MRNRVRELLNSLKDVKKLIADNQILLIILGIFLIAFVLRVWDIAGIPGGLSNKEISTVKAIKDLNEKNLWYLGSFFEAAYIYLGLIWTKIFGLTVQNLRILSGLIGGVTVVLTYVFISKWFSRKIAIFTALLFAISSFHITVSRLIIPEIVLPLVLLALFITLTYAYRTKNVWFFGLAGFLAGMGFYTSPAFVLVPFLFIISGGYFFFKNKKFFTSYKWEILASGAGFISIIIPLLVSILQNPKNYLSIYTLPQNITQLVINISQVPYILFIRTPANFFSSIGTEPLVDPLIFITSIFGLMFAVLAIARRKYFFLIVWFFVFFFYAAFKNEVYILDIIGILPVIYTFSALIFDYIIDNWFKTFPLNKKAQLAAIGLISIFFALSALYNFDRYFIAYKNSDKVKEEFSATSPIPLNKGVQNE